MIKAIYLQNFQSHRRTRIDFVPGVNAIIGDSNAGKSAILRGFRWIIKNRPTGASLVSYWNRDKRGYPVESTLVGVETPEGKTIVRARDKEFNGYRIYHQGELVREMDAGTDVPEEILSMLNISEVNIQYQHDPQFLLTNTGGEVAQFFNRIIHLDLIDRLLSVTESRRRRYEAEKAAKTVRLKETEKELAALKWVEEAGPLLERAQAYEERFMETRRKNVRLGELISMANEYKTILDSLKFIPVAEELATKIDISNGVIDARQTMIDRLRTLISTHDKYQADLGKILDTGKVQMIIEEIDTLNDKIDNQRSRWEGLSGLLSRYRQYTQDIANITKEVLSLEERLPDICPLCGGSMNGGKY